MENFRIPMSERSFTIFDSFFISGSASQDGESGEPKDGRPEIEKESKILKDLRDRLQLLFKLFKKAFSVEPWVLRLFFSGFLLHIIEGVQAGFQLGAKVAQAFCAVALFHQAISLRKESPL